MPTTDTLALQEFWPWLADHCNCILRAGTPDSILYDDDDFHWRFTQEDARTLLVQLVRGKRLIGEVFVEPEMVSSVRMTPGEKDEVIFDLMAEADGQEQVLYYFVMAHGFDESEPDVTTVRHGRLH
ncbi:hypothetical protein [Microbulbifer hydrolyticus]|uniref:Uncharacterized protein n=1 Tax=Microbulbifer hydrolyticus TaxID=48074 RepID=A0A6P1TCV4_9GAMM|nr:hypothetical protein [Microbulbifer hydrolyticus]MBB5209929.1 hypothetical protein [Microbulbifer hydrolyticus]QHQ39535.1 hypothetical protein GTQ55_11445 [Microbulbifer hydrolyticus]